MKKGKLPNIVILAVLSVITILFGIGLEVYRALTAKPEPQVSEEVLSPIDPNLDEGGLARLQSRVNLSENEIIFTTPAPSPTPAASATASPSASATPSSTLLPSGSPSPTSSP